MGDVAQPKVEVIVTIGQDRMENLKQIASELQSRGLHITNEPLENLGMISGMAESTSIEQLKQVNGVTAVEKVGTVQIPPPDSDVQ
jgi:hypothetical protein